MVCVGGKVGDVVVSRERWFQVEKNQRVDGNLPARKDPRRRAHSPEVVGKERAKPFSVTPETLRHECSRGQLWEVRRDGAGRGEVR